MVAQSNDVNAIVEKFLEYLGCYPAATGDILGLADDKSDIVGLDKLVEMISQYASPRTPDDISYT